MDRTAAVIDVGSNTLRLLVGRITSSMLAPTHTERIRLALGAEIEETGRLRPETVERAAEAVRRLSSQARAHHACSLDVFVTAPGRQAENGAELAKAIERRAQVGVRVLSAEEEAGLAFAGAVALATPDARTVAVVDLGGASTELAVGRTEAGPTWFRSVDLGALSLTTRFLDADAPSRAEVEGAQAAVAEAFAGVAPPMAEAVLAVGGSARAVGRVLGSRLDDGRLAAGGSILPLCPPDALARRFGVAKRRARLLRAACLILAEVQRRLVVPLTVADGGVREGALLLAAQQAAAA